VLRLANLLRLRAALAGDGGDVVRDALQQCASWAGFQPALRQATLLRHEKVCCHVII
jgi:hypothetical protein